MKHLLNSAKHILLVLCITYSGSVVANGYIWIIGGGPYLEHSQSQIELNVKWASQVMKNKNPDLKTRIFYSDGTDPKPDIVNYVTGKKESKFFLPYDYIFGGTELNSKEYYSHSINGVAGPTSREKLKPELEKDFSNLDKFDKALILYNGHGEYDGPDYSNNYLRLWNKTKLTVYDFEELISLAPKETPVRFIMTQCFSGAFGNAIHPNARQDTLMLEGTRCGFMAESATRESEGCSASIKVGDYRDYTTYFFAALDGKTRLNTPLTSNPDRNGDKTVSLYEAHLYTLENAYSTDLSRSTSEQYLEKWEPWYLRWLPRPKNIEKSIYFDIATKVAHKNQYSDNIIADITKLKAKRTLLYNEYKRLKKQQNHLRKSIKSKQKLIAGTLTKQFPTIKTEYKDKFVSYSHKELSTIKTTIEQHEKFKKLPELFEEKSRLTLPLLEAERKLTQVEKIARMLKLAKLDVYFSVFSTKAVYENYLSLKACEDTGL